MIKIITAVRRLMVVPFETAIAILLIISGAVGLAHYGIIDPIAALLPAWEAAALNIMAIFAGGLMTTGMGGSLKRPELSGLLLLLGVVICRFILFGYYLGFGENFVTTGVTDAAFIWAAVARLITILNGSSIVIIKGGVEE